MYWRMPDEINRYSLPSSVSIILLFCVPEIRFWNCAIVSLGIRDDIRPPQLLPSSANFFAAAVSASSNEQFSSLPWALRAIGEVMRARDSLNCSNLPILHSAPLAEVRSVVSIRTRFSSLIITLISQPMSQPWQIVSAEVHSAERPLYRLALLIIAPVGQACRQEPQRVHDDSPSGRLRSADIIVCPPRPPKSRVRKAATSLQTRTQRPHRIHRLWSMARKLLSVSTGNFGKRLWNRTLSIW